jgi:hypothetical protein
MCARSGSTSVCIDIQGKLAIAPWMPLDSQNACDVMNRPKTRAPTHRSKRRMAPDDETMMTRERSDLLAIEVKRPSKFTNLVWIKQAKLCNCKVTAEGGLGALGRDAV